MINTIAYVCIRSNVEKERLMTDVGEEITERMSWEGKRGEDLKSGPSILVLKLIQTILRYEILWY